MLTLPTAVSALDDNSCRLLAPNAGGKYSLADQLCTVLGINADRYQLMC